MNNLNEKREIKATSETLQRIAMKLRYAMLYTSNQKSAKQGLEMFVMDEI